MHKKLLILFFIPLALYSNDGYDADDESGCEPKSELYLRITHNEDPRLVNALNNPFARYCADATTAGSEW